MRILQVNKFHYLRGGAEKYFLDISQKLQEEGHEVAVFSMHHPKNLPSPWSTYFVSRISYNEPSWRDRLIAAGRMLYSFEAKRKFARLLDDFKPDIIHAHNIYNQLSPSILTAARKRGIPVVMHLHDYNLLSPNRLLFTNGSIYERCLGGHYSRCVIDKCHSNSYAKSALAALASWWHNSVLDIYRKNINLFIAPSQFMKHKSIEGGLRAKCIQVLVNFVDEAYGKAPLPTKTDDYILYFGRLSEEKGIPVLMKAVPLLRGDMRLKIVGDGPKAKAYRALAQEIAPERIDFLSGLQGKELVDLIAHARAVVLPSIWYENMPLSLLEAMALGKAVIASRIGGMPELITDKENGYLVTPGSEAELAETINTLDDANIEAIGKAARQSVEPYTIDNHYRHLMELYEAVIGR